MAGRHRGCAPGEHCTPHGPVFLQGWNCGVLITRWYCWKNKCWRRMHVLQKNILASWAKFWFWLLFLNLYDLILLFIYSSLQLSFSLLGNFYRRVQWEGNCKDHKKLKYISEGIVQTPLEHWLTWGSICSSKKPIQCLTTLTGRERLLTSEPALAQLWVIPHICAGARCCHLPLCFPPNKKLQRVVRSLLIYDLHCTVVLRSLLQIPNKEFNGFIKEFQTS